MSNFDPYDMAYIGRIIEIKDGTAIVDFNGIRRDIELGLIEAKEGDYILVHAGYAIKKVKKEDIENELKNMLNKIKD
ncbi:HypC/HybG/HupF family hydrogenase formation chaperone [Acidianus brierleyi]|uniref:Hydrogenase accessory protein n=1 Tax=Acidianus brierleyi TaxID=41673 RepID=A0A2U9IHM7_9CREN|nr:HypC/HybG/HupF family hydrogenase formation chaperone [Acidianus brierleyi]AWR95548.1 HypC/HybG/HupF family hydrogenase formation chaperone [Acidianus brierleyi]